MGDTASRYVPNINTLCIKYDDITTYKVSSGANHSMFITNFGLVYGFGLNSNGQLGFGNTTNILYPMVIPSLQNSNIRNIMCGTSHTLFVENTGVVYVCGSYLNGKLGIGAISSDLLVPTIIPYFNNINIIIYIFILIVI